MKSLYDIKPLSENALQCLNEMAQINKRETSSKDGFDYRKYRVYVLGEGSNNKFPHFHIKSLSDNWDIRMLMDGTFHSIKLRGKGMQNPEDAKPIERIAKKWVTKPNSFNPKISNGEIAKFLWDSQND